MDGIEWVVEGAGGVVLAEFDAFEEGLVVELPDGWFSCEVAVVEFSPYRSAMCRLWSICAQAVTVAGSAARRWW
ncbi:hypothetical protein EF294_21140 [Gordonia oryzae]|uniref:Uncharacterized protein n=1 Tax=Gordonia oryzae TaxID=2487349 RepID=A0A3N4G1S3_9ACTN|nr:hypothetical protein EF294_21140 [Gordonia oryzae]